MKRPTANDISPDELKSFLEHYGFVQKRVSGDHFIFCYPGNSEIMLNIPMKNPVKPTYIDAVRKKIMEIEKK